MGMSSNTPSGDDRLASRVFTTRVAFWFSGILVVVGLFLPWYTWGPTVYGSSPGGFSAVDLLTVGPTLTLLAAILMVGVVTEKPQIVAMFGALALIVIAIAIVNWESVCNQTWVRLCKVECFSPCRQSAPSIGLLLSFNGALMAAVAGTVSWRRDRARRAVAVEKSVVE